MTTEIDQLKAELETAKADRARAEETVKETRATLMKDGQFHKVCCELDEAKAQLHRAKKTFSEIYRWTQQRDISNPRSIIAGLAGDQLTKEERVKICNQEKLIDAQNTVDLLESSLYLNGESAESMKGTLGEAALKKAKADLETAKAK